MRTCRTCQHWHTYDRWDRTDDVEGPFPCRRSYPHEVMDATHEAVWPMTWADDRCPGYRRAWVQMTMLTIERAWVWLYDIQAKGLYWRIRWAMDERRTIREQRRKGL